MAVPIPHRRRRRAKSASPVKGPSARAMQRANPNASFKRASAPAKPHRQRPTGAGLVGARTGRRPASKSAPSPIAAAKGRLAIPTLPSRPAPIGMRPTPPTRAPGPVPIGARTAPGQLKKAAGVQSARQFAPGQIKKRAAGSAPAAMQPKVGGPGGLPKPPKRRGR